MEKKMECHILDQRVHTHFNYTEEHSLLGFRDLAWQGYLQGKV